MGYRLEEGMNFDLKSRVYDESAGQKFKDKAKNGDLKNKDYPKN